ncbi:MAG: TonB-dependent receptor plug domain-containing protein [Arcobacter sp.]|uniref:TonB-dependent receptor plug domain-containing protein n=1 Tax=Arcobacter sp. TaxID=1872629 RepID=UPI003B007A76
MNKKITTSLVASFLLATSNLYSQQLSEITVVSATKSEQSIKDVTSNVEVITKEEIEERHYTSVNEALNSFPGLSIVSNGGLGSTSSIYLRGMSNSRILVLVDGIRYQDPSNTSGANLSHLMINDIERIEVIKGAQSGVWGADAAAGVINIITKKATLGTSGNANLEFGSYNTKKYGATISHGTKKFDIKFSANKITTDGFTNKLTYGNRVKDYEKDGYENRTLSLNTNMYITDNSKLTFDIKDIDGLVEYDSSSANDTTMKSDIDTTIYSTSYSQEIKNQNIKLKYELSKFKRHEIGTTSGVLKFSGETQNIELSDEYKYLNSDFLIVGIGSSIDDVNYIKADNTTNQKESKDKYLYLTNSNKFTNTIFTQSLRYDRYDNFDNKFTGKVGLKYSFNQDLEFKTNIGTAYNVPNIVKELNPWGTTNPDLEPEETKSFDIGIKYKDFSLSFFESKIDNLIDWSGGGYQNVKGESIFKGFELEYSKLIEENTLFTFNYTRLSAKDEDDKYLARRPIQTLKTSFDYYGIKDFHINLNNEYVGTRYNSADKAGRQTGRYVLWNSVANYELNKNTKLYVRIDNITNKYYQKIDGYATAGRSAYLGVNYKF